DARRSRRTRMRCRDDVLDLTVLLSGASHLPSGVLTALAWDRPPVDFDREAARRHLADCAECAEDLALARECRAVADAPPRRPAWTSGVRAAGIAAALAM